jgi:PncC family amidohydrolase
MLTEELIGLGARAGGLLVKRGESIAVAESACGGLLSAALVAVPGASRFYLGGGVIYTRASFEAVLGLTPQQMKDSGVRSSTEEFAGLMAIRIREIHGAHWGLAETGASGPTGNPYGDPAGHGCFAIVGHQSLATTLRTGNADRVGNMQAFAVRALGLLIEGLESKA